MKIVGYKGMSKDMKCRDFQYEISKTYEYDHAITCKFGFHFCTRPLDILKYYHPKDGCRYFVVETEQDCIDNELMSGALLMDSTCCTRKITIVKEITLDELIRIGIKYISDKLINMDDPFKYNIDDQTKIVPENPGWFNIQKAFSSSIFPMFTRALIEGPASAIAEDGSIVISDARSKILGGSDSTVVTNTEGMSITSFNGISISGQRGVSVSGNYGVSISTDCSISISSCDGYSKTGDYGVALSDQDGYSISGDHGISVSTDHFSKSESGEYGMAFSNGESSTGENGTCISRSIYPIAKGDIGTVVLLIKEEGDNDIICWKAFQIDGEKYKPNVWYTLTSDGEVVEEEESE